MTSYVKMKSMEISGIDRPPTREQANNLGRNDDLRSITTHLVIDQSMNTKISIDTEFDSAQLGSCALTRSSSRYKKFVN